MIRLFAAAAFSLCTFSLTGPAVAPNPDALLVPWLTGAVHLDGASGEAAGSERQPLRTTTQERVVVAPTGEHAEVRAGARSAGCSSRR